MVSYAVLSISIILSDHEVGGQDKFNGSALPVQHLQPHLFLDTNKPSPRYTQTPENKQTSDKAYSNFALKNDCTHDDSVHQYLEFERHKTSGIQ
jgi:hypothetical protein